LQYNTARKSNSTTNLFTQQESIERLTQLSIQVPAQTYMDIGQGIERSLPEQIPVLPNLVTSNSHYNMMQNPNFIIRWVMQQRSAEIPAQFTLLVLVQTHMDMERDIEIPVPLKTHKNKKV